MIIVEKIIPDLPYSWKKHLSIEIKKDYFIRLKQLLYHEKQKHIIFPETLDIFKSLYLTPFNKVKVVIIGQDPYHGQKQANGLAFSVNKGQALPPSLKNIFNELKRDLKIEMPLQGNLDKWAVQGVLLLNSTLTVRSGEPNSHKHLGWGQFTNSIIQLISETRSGIVFLLWGEFAQKKLKMIDKNKHHVLLTSHPSPFSAHKGFIGSNHFSETNFILRSNNQIPIDWNIQ